MRLVFPISAPRVVMAARRGARLVAILGAAAACTRTPLPKPAPTPEPVLATPSATPRRLLPTRARSTPGPDRAVAAEGLLRVLERFGPPTTPEAWNRQAAELANAYRTERDPLARTEIIYRLADASSPQARQILSQIFSTERSLELRVEAVKALVFIESPDLVPSLLILQEALQSRQPRDLREAALDTIQTLNDTRTLPTLQAALVDPDPELRETAAKTVTYLQEVMQIEGREGR